MSRIAPRIGTLRARLRAGDIDSRLIVTGPPPGHPRGGDLDMQQQRLTANDERTLIARVIAHAAPETGWLCAACHEPAPCETEVDARQRLIASGVDPDIWRA